MLEGRTEELHQLTSLLALARTGHSAALVLRGEAGIGKSALLGAVAADGAGADGTPSAAPWGRVLRTTGVEAESELPFAGLHMLLHQVTDRVDALPAPQAAALRTALGLAGGTHGGPGDRFLTGVALLTLLSELADDGPLLCVVDDAHWLDHASADALLFAARRLTAEGVVMLFAAREPHAPPFPAAGLPELRLTGIDDDAADRILAAHAADLPPYVRRQLLAEAGGNPLALRELPAAQREGQLVASGPPSAPVPGPSRVQQAFADRIAALPEATRTLLLVAAAEGTGDLETTAAAAARLGAAVADLEPAERKQLLRAEAGRLVFRHPLIRTAAYRGAPLGARLAAHAALAEALPCVGQVDRRAWHLAAATTEPDEHVASVLERTAEHARARGGYAAEAAAFERAAQLTPDSAERARRLALAASAAADAGHGDHAARLAGSATPHLTDPALLARLARVRAGVARERDQLEAAHTVLVDTASALAERAPETAARLLYEAMTAAWTSGHRTAVDAVVERAAALGVEPSPSAPPYLPAVTGLARLAAGDTGAALPPLRRLFDAARSREHGLDLRERASVAGWFAPLGDLQGGVELAADLEHECREQGAVGPLPLVLLQRARARVLLGRHGCALAGAEDGVRIARDSGQHHYAHQLTGVLAHLAALDGDEARVRELAGHLDPRQAPPGRVWGAAALPLLELGLGRYEAALRGYEDLAAGPAGHTVVALHCLPDHVEAAVRAGRPDAAHEAARRYADWAEHTGAAWARAIAARCRALLADEATAQTAPTATSAPSAHSAYSAYSAYEEALTLHTGDGRPFEQARTRLLFGEWLRRAGRRSEARAPLRAALDAFEQIGAAPWAGRARAELRATGESRARQGGGRVPLERLTPQERQVVRLAAAGMTNRDIGAQLFLSPRTVGYHLYNAYPKLGVSSRGELTRLGFGAEEEELSA
ncbi:Putative HTH-type transcriptional regulator [Streptomyces sp. YIM 121038]|uniref:helix-turn-helix transcriptional regulator n=1 Tax=Streptomyces sp. YIM 121038 TaxID=2136401 RepID=UPI00111033AE|nr:LuxR family transcriptional regulator [Streptomyces sp. YIM 121038]QCX75537.1 Putative HTH-type transcriptional regulator [Streptomyces sp. YIM 121038]